MPVQLHCTDCTKRTNWQFSLFRSLFTRLMIPSLPIGSKSSSRIRVINRVTRHEHKHCVSQAAR